MSFHRKQPMGTFRRGLTISPFQIPLLAYFFFAGLLSMPTIASTAKELHAPVWSVWNFFIIMTIGAGLATFSRFNGNERIEEFGLWLLSLAVIIAVGLEVMGHEYALGDEVAILSGCLLRIRVLRKSRKAETVAIQIATDNDGESS